MTKKLESSVGSVYRNKKTKLWVAQWRAADYTGKVRTYRSTTNRTETAARKSLDGQRAKAEKNAQPPALQLEFLTVGEWLDRWHAERRNTLRASTIQDEARRIGELRALVGEHSLRGLTQHDVTMVCEEMKALKAGRPRAHRMLYETFRQALGDVKPRLDPCLFDETTKPKVRKVEARMFDQKDLVRILKTVDRPREGDTVVDETFAAIIHTLAMTGCRIGECLALHWADVDLDSGEIHVRASVSEIVGEGVVRGLTKSGKSRRIPIPPELVERLRRLRSRARLPWVFSNERGRPFRASGLLRRRLHPLLAELGLAKGGFHQFRHSGISMMIKSGVDLKTVQTLAGHSKLSVTMDIYAHHVPGMERAASNVLAGLLSGDQSIVAEK